MSNTTDNTTFLEALKSWEFVDSTLTQEEKEFFRANTKDYLKWHF